MSIWVSNVFDTFRNNRQKVNLPVSRVKFLNSSYVYKMLISWSCWLGGFLGVDISTKIWSEKQQNSVVTILPGLKKFSFVETFCSFLSMFTFLVNMDVTNFSTMKFYSLSNIVFNLSIFRFLLVSQMSVKIKFILIYRLLFIVERRYFKSRNSHWHYTSRFYKVPNIFITVN